MLDNNKKKQNATPSIPGHWVDIPLCSLGIGLHRDRGCWSFLFCRLITIISHISYAEFGDGYKPYLFQSSSNKNKLSGSCREGAVYKSHGSG